MPKHLFPSAAALVLSLTLTGCATTGSGGAVDADASASAIKGTRVISTATGYPGAVDPLALRMPAQVMRIWIAPWEDSRGDLHAPGYVYTEIEPRRWTLGAPAERDRETLIRPLQIERREAPIDRRSHRENGMSRKPGRTKEPDTGPNLLGS
jgi:hypothetical protein